MVKPTKNALVRWDFRGSIGDRMTHYGRIHGVVKAGEPIFSVLDGIKGEPMYQADVTSGVARVVVEAFEVATPFVCRRYAGSRIYVLDVSEIEFEAWDGRPIPLQPGMDRLQREGYGRERSRE